MGPQLLAGRGIDGEGAVRRGDMSRPRQTTGDASKLPVSPV